MVGSVSQTLAAHMVRTRKIPFIQSCASVPVMLSGLGATLLGFLIVATPIREVLDSVKLPANYWPWFFGTTIAYTLTVEVAKRLYIKITKERIQ